MFYIASSLVVPWRLRWAPIIHSSKFRRGLNATGTPKDVVKTAVEWVRPEEK